MNDNTTTTTAECWCGEPATYLVPVDPEVTDPTHQMRDRTPALAVCYEHVDRDGYEAIDPAPADVPTFRMTAGSDTATCLTCLLPVPIALMHHHTHTEEPAMNDTTTPAQPDPARYHHRSYLDGVFKCRRCQGWTTDEAEHGVLCWGDRPADLPNLLGFLGDRDWSPARTHSTPLTVILRTWHRKVRNLSTAGLEEVEMAFTHHLREMYDLATDLGRDDLAEAIGTATIQWEEGVLSPRALARIIRKIAEGEEAERDLADLVSYFTGNPWTDSTTDNLNTSGWTGVTEIDLP